MSSPVKGQKGLAGHDRALGGLLDSLFDEPETARNPRSREAVVCDPVAEPPLPVDPGGLNDSAAAPLEDESPVRGARAPVVPAWSEGGFRALLFRIGGFRFAAPLVRMRGIVAMPDRLTRIPAQPAWHLGVARYRGQSVVVADFGLLTGVQARKAEPRYLLMIGDGDVAITCDGIEDEIGVEPQHVSWAKPDSARAWLAGLLTDQMCGLLDTDVLSGQVRHG